jgi:uncharacterized sulfatase
MTDTQGANCVGCYGRPELQTPCIDALAAGGVRFDRAYTTCPLCTPARSALFTGTFPHTNGAWANELPMGYNVKTLGQRLSDGGVRTAYTGKWHLAATDYFGDGVCPDGWDPDYWYDGRNYLEDIPDDLRTFSRQYHKPERIREAGFGEEMTFAHRVSDRAIRFLGRHGEGDFFLAVSYDEPHHPSIAPPPFCDLFQDFEFEVGNAVWDDLAGKPDHQRHWAEEVDAGGRGSWREKTGSYVCQPYFACNTYVDHEIGRVLDAVAAHAPGALVIYTSDHGEMMHAHRLHSKGPAMYDEITRIPFIVRWPGVIPPGTVSSATLSQIDVTPTVLDYFGLEIPAFLEGKSLLPFLADPASGPQGTVFIEFNRQGVQLDGSGGFKPIRCAFDGRHKLVLNLLHTDELYDLREDPDEMTNLIDSEGHAQIRERLLREIIEWMNGTRDPFRAPEWEHRYWNRPELIRWGGGRRMRPDDGYERPPLLYGTGRPEG